MATTETEKFLRSIWMAADRGFLCLFAKQSKNAFFYDLSRQGALSEAADDIPTMGSNQDLYFGLGLQKIRPPMGRGREEGVIAIPGFWMDLDVSAPGAHKNHKLPKTNEEAIRFADSLPKPPNMVVSSGHGIHAYWLFSEIRYFSSDDDRENAKSALIGFQEHLNSKAEEFDWKFDRTANLAWILRLPGTLNYKSPDHPKKVSIIKETEIRYSYSEMASDLGSHKRTKTKKPSAINGVPLGERNNRIFAYACDLCAKGIGDDEIDTLVHIAASRCTPPLDRSETDACIKSAKKTIHHEGFFKGTRFFPARVADHFLSKWDVYHDGSGFYRYVNEGYWARIEDREVAHEIATLLGDNANEHRIRDAMSTLASKAWKNPEGTQKNKKFLNLKNGMLNIIERKLYPHDKDYYSTVQVPIIYDPEAGCPNFNKFLGEVFEGEPSKIETVKDFTGYILYPDPFIHKCLFLIGSGANGKSVFVNTIQKLVGERNTSSIDLHQFSDKFMLSEIKDKLLNVGTEIQANIPIDTSVIKKLTSGEWIETRPIFKSSIRFRPIVKCIFCMNEMPLITDKTPAFRRRVIPIKFNHTFMDKREDKFLEQALEKELSGILNWALDGTERVIKNKCIYSSPELENDKLDFLRNLDPILIYAEERLIFRDDLKEPKTEIYIDYTDWSKESGLKGLGKIKFYRHFQDTFKLSIDTYSRSSFKGVALKYGRPGV